MILKSFDITEREPMDISLDGFKSFQESIRCVVERPVIEDGVKGSSRVKQFEQLQPEMRLGASPTLARLF